MTESPMPYPKGDLRRLLSVVAAVDALPAATVAAVAERTGLSRQTVTDLIQTACEQAAVRIRKNGSSYELVEWGPVLAKKGARLALAGELPENKVET